MRATMFVSYVLLVFLAPGGSPAGEPARVGHARRAAIDVGGSREALTLAALKPEPARPACPTELAPKENPTRPAVLKDRPDAAKPAPAVKVAVKDAVKVVVKPEAFKTLVNPNCSHCVDEAKRRKSDLADDDRCLAWIRGKYDGGAIPVRFFLAPYRVISDTYGVFVYDPDAGYMRGYEPSLDFTFHGWRNGVMVMKHKDGTLYSCLSGRAFDGPRKGDVLKPVATIETNWGPWLRAYPGTVAYHMFDKYQPVELPKGENADSASTRVAADPRLAAGAEVIGVAVGDKAKAYPIAELQKSSSGMIVDNWSRQKIYVLWQPQTRTAVAVAATLDGARDATLTLAKELGNDGKPKNAWAPFIDEATGSHFDIVGRAIDGKLKGQTLRWLPGVQCRWFAWTAEYPKTEIYAAGSRDDASRKGAQDSTPAASPKGAHSAPATNGSTGGVAAAAARPTNGVRPMEGVIVHVGHVDPKSVKQWSDEGHTAVVVVLDEYTPRESFAESAKTVAAAKMDLYYWIEIARNLDMAKEHPQWMASLGMHNDWQQRFPKVAPPKPGEVAKAFPWVPIGYRQPFEAHRARVAKLLADRAGEPYRGLLLNDLQGGPAACGCGNLQCRWAVDYGVAATATRLDGDDVAPRFVAEVRKLAPGKSVIPVWTTECEDIDLPAKHRADGKTTGLCGGVGCAKGTCPKAFAKQWSALVAGQLVAGQLVAGQIAGQPESIGVLCLHKELQRSAKEHYAKPASWIADAVKYIDTVPAQHGGPKVDRGRLWLVLQGSGVEAAERNAARQVAIQTGAGAVLTSLAPISQSYEPRIVAANK